VGGFQFHFSRNISLNIETFYRQIFDRLYSKAKMELQTYPTPSETHPLFWFDGQGRVWGVDVLLQKAVSRYLDGWLSYSYNLTRYKDPSDPDYRDEYYPPFHRFHNLNLIVNLRVPDHLVFTLHFGLASGNLIRESGGTTMTPIAMDNQTIYYDIFKQSPRYSDTGRNNWSVPLDVKVSLLFHPRRGESELYLSVENLLIRVLKNQGGGSASDGDLSISTFELPVPMASFGFKWSY
jgi:hypothetical protein